MNFWIITDTHLGHNLLFENGSRPKGFEDKILTNVAQMTCEEDVLIHLGDVSFYDDAAWHEGFIGASKCRTNILITGNHDRRTLSWYYDIGWSFVCCRCDLRIYGMNFRFTHRPLDFTEMIGADRNIHGHVHDHKHVHIGAWNIPINIEKTLAPVTLKSLLGNKFR